MTGLDARPERTTHEPGDEVVVLVDSDECVMATVVVSHLGDEIVRHSVAVGPGRTRVSLGQLAVGGYGVLVSAGSDTAATAVEVLARRTVRPRYGFVARFEPGRDDLAAVTDSLRAFHLTHVQLYDWMYRHAQLLPPESATGADEFDDALGRRLSLRTVRSVVDAVHHAGAEAIGYAAVYAAADDFATAHPDQVLHHRDGTPWRLADFLTIMDVRAGSAWTTHIVGQMASAVRDVPFDGLHLDQYGNPKLALAADGQVVDLADDLPDFVDAVRDALPDATLIFNNVNDFPTRRTAQARQDATYIEVWPPHETHADLAALVDRARAAAPGRPVVLAAYLEPFARQVGPQEVAAARLALATVWAAGGHYLLFGEDRAVLVDPYYPRNATLTPEAVGQLRVYADFCVALGDVLFDPAADEVTGAVTGGDDDDLTVLGADVSHRPAPGGLWLRVNQVGTRLVVQLVDFRAQSDGRWNAPRQVPDPVAGVTLRVRVVSPAKRVRFGHPAGGPGLVDLPVTDDGDRVQVAVPDFDTWAVIVVDR